MKRRLVCAAVGVVVSVLSVLGSLSVSIAVLTGGSVIGPVQVLDIGVYNGLNKGVFVGPDCGFEIVGEFGPFCATED